MKKLTILLFSILISFNSYGEWTKLKVISTNEVSFYLDWDRIKKHEGYVYWWHLTDKLKPSKDGDMSAKIYSQGDCGINRYKNLSFIFYKQPMGGGSGETFNPPNPEWDYPSPGSSNEFEFQLVCAIAK